MRSFVLAGLGLIAILCVAVLATTWHSWVSWDFAVSIQLGEMWMAICLGVLVLAVVLLWRWAVGAAGTRR
jgi:hypothetical protein